MKKLKITLSFLITITGFAASVQAQNDTTKHHSWFNRKISGAMQIQATYRKSDLSQLNAVLAPTSIVSVPDNNIWLNLSMSHLHKKWLFEDGIGGTFTSQNNPANYGKSMISKYNQFQFYTRAGYDISSNANIRFYPFVGLNLFDAMLRIQDINRNRNTQDFSTELTNLTASKTLWNPQLGFEFGVGFDYLIKMTPKKMDYFTVQRNIPIGLRIGYYLQATNNRWQFDDNYNLNNGPNDKQSAVFVSFNIGLGYAIKK